MTLVAVMMKKPSKSLYPGGEQDQSDPQNEDRSLGGALFRETSLASRGRFLGYIRHHAKGRGEAMTEGQTGLGGAPPSLIWASWLPSHDPKLQVPSFIETLPWYFIPILFPAKSDKNQTFAQKTVSDSEVLSKYIEILEQIFEQSAWKSRYTRDVSPLSSLLGLPGNDPGSMRLLSRRDFKHNNCQEGQSPEWQPRRSTREPPEWSANS
jgi:hypothetical protein